MSRRRRALYLFLGLGVVLALLAASTIAKVRRGEDLLWIAELWAPAAVLSIGLVTGIEFLIAPPLRGPLRGPAAESEPHEPATSGQAPVASLEPKKKVPVKAKKKPVAKKSPKK